MKSLCCGRAQAPPAGAAEMSESALMVKYINADNCCLFVTALLFNLGPTIVFYYTGCTYNTDTHSRGLIGLRGGRTRLSACGLTTVFSCLPPDPEGVLLLGGGRRGVGEEGNHLPILHHASLPRVRRADPAGGVLEVSCRTPASRCDALSEHEAVGESAGPAAEGRLEHGAAFNVLFSQNASVSYT